MGGVCSAKGNNVKSPKKGKSMSVKEFGKLFEENAGSDYGDDSSLGENYLHIDMGKLKLMD